jgi:hypothetical protein
MSIGTQYDSPGAITLKDTALKVVKLLSYLGIEVGRTARFNQEVGSQRDKAGGVNQV